MFVLQLHSISCLPTMSIPFCATYCTVSYFLPNLFYGVHFRRIWRNEEQANRFGRFVEKTVLTRVSANFSKETKNPNPSPTGKIWFGFYWFGAGSGGRTHTVSLPRDFESRTSANSIIPARFNFDFFRLQKNRNRKHFPFQNRLASPASYLGIIHHFPEKIKPF